MQKHAVNSTDGWAQCLSVSPVFSHIIWSWDGSRRERGRPSDYWKCSSQTTWLYQEDTEALPTLFLLTRACIHTHTEKEKSARQKKTKALTLSVLAGIWLVKNPQTDTKWTEMSSFAQFNNKASREAPKHTAFLFNSLEMIRLTQCVIMTTRLHTSTIPSIQGDNTVRHCI